MNGVDKVEHGSQKYEPSLLVQEPNVLHYRRNILEPSSLSLDYSCTEAEGSSLSGNDSLTVRPRAWVWSCELRVAVKHLRVTAAVGTMSMGRERC